MTKKWANKYHMTWSTPECLMLSLEKPTLSLNNQPLAITSMAKYLESSLATNGITDAESINEIHKSIATLQQWENNEDKSLQLAFKSKIYLAKIVLLPSAEFGFHLSNISIATKIAHDTLRKNIIRWVVSHCSYSKIKRGSTILKIPDISTRRKILQATRIIKVAHHLSTVQQSNMTTHQQQIRASDFFHLLINHAPAISVSRSTIYHQTTYRNQFQIKH